jgi:hypothetical protein
LLAFMDGELPEAAVEACAAHLEACWSCRAERDEIASTIALLVRVRNQSLPEQCPKSSSGARTRFLQALSSLDPEVPAWSARWIGMIPGVERPLRLAALLAGIALLALFLGIAKRGPATLSAAEVLHRADERLAALVTPGNVFYRRWASTLTVSRPSTPAQVIKRRCEEWAEGAIPNRLASRTTDEDGRLVEAAWSFAENGERRLFYYNAGDHQLGDPRLRPDAPAGTVFRWPTRREVTKLLEESYPASRRPLLQFAFDFALMDPVVSESRFPEAVEQYASLYAAAGTTYGENQPAIRLSIHLPRGAVFDLGDGRFSVLVGDWRGTYVYDATSYLLQSFDGTWEGRDGLRARYELRLDQARVIPASPGAFDFKAPSGARENALSTEDVVAEIDRAFQEDERRVAPPRPVDGIHRPNLIR